jgi:hypothetical protein
MEKQVSVTLTQGDWLALSVVLRHVIHWNQGQTHPVYFEGLPGNFAAAFEAVDKAATPDSDDCLVLDMDQ